MTDSGLTRRELPAAAAALSARAETPLILPSHPRTLIALADRQRDASRDAPPDARRQVRWY